MQKPDQHEAELQFSQPIRQILTMTVAAGLVGTGAWISYRPFIEIVSANPYLNGFILVVFAIGVFSCFWQVLGLISSVSWIKGFALNRVGHEFVGAPRLLTSLATLLKARRSHMQLSASSSRSILDSMATRLDESREITRYIINLLIFLGLLGTFYGLATTVPAVVETIGTLAPSQGESSADVFGNLMVGLQKQMGGMGTAFSSSLLGLAGSLVVGLLDLFSGNSQNRFYRELEEWLSTMTQVGYSGGEGEGGSLNYDSSNSEVAFHRMAESVEALHTTFIQSEATQSETGERLAGLSTALTALSGKMGGGQSDAELQKTMAAQNALLDRIAAGQEAMAAAMLKDDEDSVDAESRMRLRSIDVQLLRILEEMSAGRQDTIAELRADIAALTKAVRSQGRKPPVQPQATPTRGR